jgi:hypothetical protein
VVNATDVGRLHRDCPLELDDRLARRVGQAEFAVAGANSRSCACSDRGWPKDITTKASGSSMRMSTLFFGRMATVKVPTIPRAASHVRGRCRRAGHGKAARRHGARPARQMKHGGAADEARLKRPAGTVPDHHPGEQPTR